MAADVISIAEIAEKLGVSRAYVYQLQKDGKLPSVRLGRRVIVPLPAWNQWLGQLSDDAIRSLSSGVTKGVTSA